MTVDDLADHPRVLTGGAHRVERAERLAPRHDREHPETEVEDLLHLVVAHVAGGLDLGEDARLVPGAAVHDAVAVIGE